MNDPCLIAVILLESSLLAGLLLVGWRLLKARVNGPCRLCLCLLWAWRMAVIVNLPFGVMRWDYVWGVLFGHALLYATYHLAVVVQSLRSRSQRMVD